MEPIFANKHRYSITWFIKEMMKQGLPEVNFEFNTYEYINFEKLYKDIYILYEDYTYSEKIIKMRSVEKIAISDLGNNSYKLLESEINDMISNQLTYYFGVHDIEGSELENEAVKEYSLYLHKYYKVLDFSNPLYPKVCNQSVREVKYLKIKIDKEFLTRSFKRVYIDIFKIASQLNSTLITDIDEVTKLYGFFAYISNIQLFYANALVAYNKTNSVELVVEFDRDYLCKKISHHTEIDINKVNEYLDYLTLQPSIRGVFNEFPLIQYNNKVLFIPSSFMLNDLQFSIVNGHYYKDIKFINRDNTVSQSVVDKISDKVKTLKNIICLTNKYYDDKTLGVKSDIDVAIYDISSNILIVVECKWKDNVFVGSDDYIEIENSINKIFNKQINSHKTFLEYSSENIKYIFGNDNRIENIVNNVEILYIVVDKRVQYHLEDRHILSEFLMLQLLEDNIENEILDSKRIIDEINSMSTTVSYRDFEPKDYIILDSGKKVFHQIFKKRY